MNNNLPVPEPFAAVIESAAEIEKDQVDSDFAEGSRLHQGVGRVTEHSIQFSGDHRVTRLQGGEQLLTLRAAAESDRAGDPFVGKNRRIADAEHRRRPVDAALLFVDRGPLDLPIGRDPAIAVYLAGPSRC